MKPEAAAKAAGYSAATAKVQAGNLLRRADIKAELQRLRRGDPPLVKPDVNTGEKLPEDLPDKLKMPKASYEDAKDFLIDAMNHKYLPIAARAEYAKALLPYQHARIAEAGKKQGQKDRAKELIGDGEPRGRGRPRSKWSPKDAPKLVAVK